jgi:hypothetical protein
MLHSMARDSDESELRNEHDGIHFGTPPIFCEQCPDLAMAVVDDSALCLRCMMAELKGRSESWIAEHARPLLVPAS